MLSNVDYLHHLSTNRFFEDKAFVNYLSYLQYMNKRPYVNFIGFPQCLYFLRHLQDSKFRDELAKPEFVAWLKNQQRLHWGYWGYELKHWLNERIEEPPPPVQPEAQLQQASDQQGENALASLLNSQDIPMTFQTDTEMPMVGEVPL
eukprot:TRINITY_DN3797_c0_g1_i2.p2 TRINITY_DN3797_c0_g1~~TRINITY_DN3797_c0_g1_i2.p2  ORF type:complete len:147 (-),score=19.93 TRINITY_DN3797_c0_g1_i2:132-572(-)